MLTRYACYLVHIPQSRKLEKTIAANVAEILEG